MAFGRRPTEDSVEDWCLVLAATGTVLSEGGESQPLRVPPFDMDQTL